MWHKGSRRAGFVLGWFILLSAAAASTSAVPAQVGKPDDAGHPLPPLARAALDNAALPARDLNADLSIPLRRELEEVLARPPPVSESVWKVDLSRHLRLAVVCQPATTASRLSVPLLRLEW